MGSVRKLEARKEKLKRKRKRKHKEKHFPFECMLSLRVVQLASKVLQLGFVFVFVVSPRE